MSKVWIYARGIYINADEVALVETDFVRLNHGESRGIQLYPKDFQLPEGQSWELLTRDFLFVLEKAVVPGKATLVWFDQKSGWTWEQMLVIREGSAH